MRVVRTLLMILAAGLGIVEISLYWGGHNFVGPIAIWKRQAARAAELAEEQETLRIFRSLVVDEPASQTSNLDSPEPAAAERQSIRDKLREALDLGVYPNYPRIRYRVRDLAALGDSRAEAYIIRQMNSEEGSEYSHAIKDAAEAATPALIGALGKLLYSDRPGMVVYDVHYSGPAPMAMNALSQIVPDPPATVTEHDFYTMEDAPTWRRWWQDNVGDDPQKLIELAEYHAKAQADSRTSETQP